MSTGRNPVSTIFVGAVLLLLIARACQSAPEPGVVEGEGQAIEPAQVEGAGQERAPSEAQAPVAEGLRWQVVEEGLEVAAWEPAVGVKAHVVRVSLERWSLRSLVAERLDEGFEEGQEGPAWTARRFVEETGARAAINGGFFDPKGMAMGLRVSGGRQLVAYRKVDWGVYFIREGRPKLVHARDWKADPRVDFAIECGPRLVHAGAPFKLKPNLHRRTAIGHGADGRVVLLVTLDPVDLNDLAAGMARPTSEGGLGLVEALNLDGGPSTQLEIDAEGASRWSLLGLTGVADAVAVFPVKEAPDKRRRSP